MLPAAAEGQRDDVVFSVLQYLQFPCPAPFLKLVFAYDRLLSVHAYAEAVAAVIVDRPEGHCRDAERDGVAADTVKRKVDVL